MTDDLVSAAIFFEQVAGDFPETELHLPGGIIWTRQPYTSRAARFGMWVRWRRQGRPRHRGIITRIGSCQQDIHGCWHLTGWAFTGDRCPDVPTLDVEQLDGRQFLRALCGWSPIELERLQYAGSTRRRWAW